MKNVYIGLGIFFFAFSVMLGVSAYQSKAQQYRQELQEIEEETAPLKTKQEELEKQLADIKTQIESNQDKWQAIRCSLAIEEGNRDEYCFL